MCLRFWQKRLCFLQPRPEIGSRFQDVLKRFRARLASPGVVLHNLIDLVHQCPLCLFKIPVSLMEAVAFLLPFVHHGTLRVLATFLPDLLCGAVASQSPLCVFVMQLLAANMQSM